MPLATNAWHSLTLTFPDPTHKGESKHCQYTFIHSYAFLDLKHFIQGMGRKKIKIANIPNARQKHITFMRRKAGIIKKCHELAILCNARVLLAVWDEDQDCHVFATDTVDRLMQAYEAAYLGVGERRLAEYEVEQVGEGSEDLVVKRVAAGQPFCRDRYVPRFVPQAVNIGGMTISNRTQQSHAQPPWSIC